MEGLIPFVIDVIRRSNGRSGYRSVSSDGGSSRGGGSRRHLIDYSELPDAPAAAANVGVDWTSGTLHRRARPEYADTMAGRRNEEYARPASAVAAGPAYRRK
ncbi:hypothetical protein BDA96_02G375400 [Sorghum bicolor]|jgi:hypothetical protein|uniref:Uncharacterized protein n=2 Tax=Sorghum bicolor TaxID=4558 RepID=A0A921RUT3_SORBI|nr:uncharacterized protein LOC8058379 [Sorghum bicolor]EER99629.1 hypothetical protein SORBI_3002G358300 [Sorghum bicolor]KAG0545602.1 hypothetical protein BDA96_02G375400 [Sorghum bicolor]|eukprot:XP_002463108.1 uncharacterized protein LOC8058379 [Sorghum bicolor]